MNSGNEKSKEKSDLMKTGRFNKDIYKDKSVGDTTRDDVIQTPGNNNSNPISAHKAKGKETNEKVIKEENDSSYVNTLKNYNPPGGRKIESSKSEDLEWQSNSKVTKKEKPENNTKSTKGTVEEENTNKSEEYSRFKKDKKGFGSDFDSDFFWQT